MLKLEELKFDDRGLIPAVIQEYRTKVVLMVAYMNLESLKKTLATKETWFWSRSRQALWHKGETSGNVQQVKSISYDCDGDTLLILVEQQGNACHTGAQNCFFNKLYSDQLMDLDEGMLAKLYDLIAERRINPKSGSYTNYLFEKGIDKILKKVGEEASEVIIAAKNPDTKELIYEASDLIYHLLVLLNEKDVKLEDIYQELARRNS